MDFILWPRNDIEKIVCLLFSRWKGADDEPYRPVQVRPIYSVSRRKRPRLRVKREMFSTHRPSLNFTMVTTRSSACTLWVGRTRLERWWTTQVSLCFSSWTDSTYRWASAPKPHPWLHRHGPWWCPRVVSRRLRKPRPQFSSCAAFAFTCPRISWPAGVWEA